MREQYESKIIKAAIAFMLIFAIVISSLMTASAKTTSSSTCLKNETNADIVLVYGTSKKISPFEKNSNVTYTTSSKKIACVDINGTVKSMGRGTCTITAVNNETGEIITYTVSVKVVWWQIITNLINYIRNLNCPVCKRDGGESAETTTEITTESTTEATTESTTEGTTESTTEGTTEITTESTTEGTTEITTESTTESTTEDQQKKPKPGKGYVARYKVVKDSSNNYSLELKWNKFITGENYVTVDGVATDYDDNVFVTCSSISPSTVSTSSATDPVLNNSTSSSSNSASVNLALQKKISFGGTGSEIVTGVAASSEGYYVCGRTTSKDGDFKEATKAETPFGFVQKYNSDGKLLKTIIIMSKKAETYVTDITTLRDGKVVVCGYQYIDDATKISSTPFVAVYDGDGNQLFKKTFEGTYNDYFYSVAATSDGFVIGGRVSSYDGDFSDSESNLSSQNDFTNFDGLVADSLDCVVIKYSESGVQKWYSTVSTKVTDYFHAIVADGDGGCAVGGYYTYVGSQSGSVGGTLSSLKFIGGADSVLVKINSSGEKEWIKQIAGDNGDYVVALEQYNGTYFAAGYSNSSSSSLSQEFSMNYGEYDGFIDAISSSGEQIDMLNLGGSEDDGVQALAVTESTLLAAGNGLSQDIFFENMNQNAKSTTTPARYDGFVVKYNLS